MKNDSIVTLVDRKGKPHEIDLSKYVKEKTNMSQAHQNVIDNKDGSRTYIVYPPNSNASIIIILSSGRTCLVKTSINSRRIRASGP